MSDGYLSKDRRHLARLQRERRARLRRVDYYPSEEALAVIEARQKQCPAGSVDATNSAVLNAIVTAWAVAAGFLPPKARARKEGVTLPEFRHQSRARACAYDSEAAAGNSGPVRARAYEFGACPDDLKKQQRGRTVCGAKRHRDGQPCQAPSEPGRRRCRFHGGRSTGPRTEEGRKRALANLRRGRQ